LLRVYKLLEGKFVRSAYSAASALGPTYQGKDLKGVLKLL
jgi:hypothetical protein